MRSTSRSRHTIRAELRFDPIELAALPRRLTALRQAVQLLQEAGLPDRARGLQEDIGRLERERAIALARAATPPSPGGDANVAQEVHALREQVDALRHEVRELRELLQRLQPK